MKALFAILLISITLLTGCQKDTKQYENGKLIYEGAVNNNGVREGSGKLYDPDTGKVIFEGMFRNGLQLKGTIYDKNGKNPQTYGE